MTAASKYGPTPSQTVGPYFTMRITGEGENVLTSPETVGERIRIEGFVYDGDRGLEVDHRGHPRLVTPDLAHGFSREARVDAHRYTSKKTVSSSPW